MLDYATLAAHPSFASLDFGAIAASLHEEAEYLAAAIERAAQEGLLPGHPGIRFDRAHLHVRAFNIAAAAHVFAAHAARERPRPSAEVIYLVPSADPPPAPRQSRLQGIVSRLKARLDERRERSAASVRGAA